MKRKDKKISIKIAIVIVGILILGISASVIMKVCHKTQNPIATLEIEGFGTVKIELYPEMAPSTVANFIKLANSGFYNNLTFHRVVKDFMIQGGDLNGDGTGAPYLSNIQENVEADAEYTILGEFFANGYANTLRHTKGVISMARADYSSQGLEEEGYNSAGSQFFILTSDVPSLDGYYASFGKVIEGYDIIEQISQIEVKANEQGEESTPVNPPKITNITVDTFGIDYGMPIIFQDY